MKRFLAMILLLAIFGVFIVPAPSTAASNQIDFLGAEFVSGHQGGFVVDLKFSAPVHIFNTSFIWLCDSYNPNPGVNGSYQYGVDTTKAGYVTYLNPQSGADHLDYSNTVRVTFRNWYSTLPQDTTFALPAGAVVRLVEYGLTDDLNDGTVSPQVIKGLDGGEVTANKKSGDVDIACESVSPGAISLQSSTVKNNVVTLTFSKPVRVHNSNFVFLCDRLEPNPGVDGSYQHGVQSIAYANPVTGADSKEYSTEVNITFDIGPLVQPPEGAGVRMMEYALLGLSEDLCAGSLNPAVISGITGERVLTTAVSANGTVEGLWTVPQVMSDHIVFESAVSESPETFSVTLNFSAPVRIFSTGHVWLCDRYNPNPGVNGSYQYGVSSVEYVNAQLGSDELEYSDEIIVTFNSKGDATIPRDAGIRLVEYPAGAVTGDLSNGTVNPQVIKGMDGSVVQATVRDGMVDIAFKRIDFEGTSIYPQSIVAIDGTSVTVKFSDLVRVSDISDIALCYTDGTLCQGTVSAYEYISAQIIDAQEYAEMVKFTCTDMAAAQSAADGHLRFLEGSILDRYARSITCSQPGTPDYAMLYLDPWADPSVDYGTDFSDKFEPGAAYSFMNCDTGRMLKIGAIDEFILVKESGTNLYSLKDAGTGKYIDLTGAAPALSEEKCLVLLREFDNARYQLVIQGTVVLADNDIGTGNDAGLKQLAENQTPIESGWYLTKSGETRPLKLMPMGDSITYGVNPDLASGMLPVSYRAALSADLVETFDRIVFVGSERTAVTDINDETLLRHSGYPGYVVEDIWKDNANHPGVLPMLPGLLEKYAPDVVCLMLGTNDCGRISGSGYNTNAMEGLMTRYENFASIIDDALPDNGLLICATVTPHRNAGMNGIYNDFNARLRKLVPQMNADGMKVVLADNNAYVSALGDAAISSDSIHLSVLGDTGLHASYLDVITRAYGADSIKKLFSVSLADGAAGVELEFVNADGSAIHPGAAVSFTVKVKAGYTGTPVLQINGQAANAVDGIYTLTDIWESYTVSVAGVSLVPTPEPPVTPTEPVDTAVQAAGAMVALLMLGLGGLLTSVGLREKHRRNNMT